MVRKILLVGGLLAVAVVLAGVFYFRPFDKPSNLLLLHGLVEIQEVRLGSKVPVNWRSAPVAGNGIQFRNQQCE